MKILKLLFYLFFVLFHTLLIMAGKLAYVTFESEGCLKKRMSNLLFVLRIQRAEVVKMMLVAVTILFYFVFYSVI